MSDRVTICEQLEVPLPDCKLIATLDDDTIAKIAAAVKAEIMSDDFLLALAKKVLDLPLTVSHVSVR